MPDRPVKGASSAGARGAVLLVVALVLGVVLLQKIDHGKVSVPTTVHSGSTTPTTRRSPTVSVVATTTTRPLRAADQVKVLTANASSTNGLATTTGTFLRNAGYNALTPANATKTLDTTLVEYKPDFEPEARVIAQLLGLPASSVRPLEDSPPVSTTLDPDVIVIIGADLKLPATTSTTKK